MYSDRRYSLARYSVNRADKSVEAAERFTVTMGALVGAAVPVEGQEWFAGALQGSAQGTASVVSAFAARNSLDAAVCMSANVLIQTAFDEVLQASVYGQKNLPASMAAAEVMAAAVWAAKDIFAALSLAEQLDARTEGSKNIPSAFMAAEVLTTSLEATTQTMEQAVFQLTIPPGGELRIDSGLFTVLLNGENALHTQSGDWINISRELLRLVVESASGGGLEGQLIYTERYL